MSSVLSNYPTITYEGLGASLAKIGFVYTDELKTDQWNEKHRTIFDVNFLKRSFVKEGNKVLAPLDLETIMQKIQWKKKKDNTNELFFQKFENFIAELSVHNEITFKEKSKLLFDALESTVPNHTIQRSLPQSQWRVLWAKVSEAY